MNNWLRSELDSSYNNKQSPINILTELTSTKDDLFVFHILNFFIVILLLTLFRNHQLIVCLFSLGIII